MSIFVLGYTVISELAILASGRENIAFLGRERENLRHAAEKALELTNRERARLLMPDAVGEIYVAPFTLRANPEESACEVTKALWEWLSPPKRSGLLRAALQNSWIEVAWFQPSEGATGGAM